MRYVSPDNQKIYKAYENSILSESKNGFRRKVQTLDDTIDDFIDSVEKKIDEIKDNPNFQRKMYQLLADTTKEHSEFLMAMKRVASAIDSGAKVIPFTKGEAGDKSYDMTTQEVPDNSTSQGPAQPKNQQPPGPENNVAEAYQAGKKFESTKDIFKTAHGWLDDTEKMIKYNNYEGAAKNFEVFQNKVCPDIMKFLNSLVDLKGMGKI